LNVTILFFAGLREITNTKESILHTSKSPFTLHDVVVSLVKKYPALKDIIFHKIPTPQIDEYLGDEIDFQIRSVKFAKNRKIISYANQDVTFSNGDTIALFLPLLGG
jgi:molybdopterin converting factor small subunit